MTETELHRPRIALAAAEFGLDKSLVEAVVVIESGGDEFAWNPEPKYRYFWDVKRGRPFRKVTPGEVRSKFPPADFPTIAGDKDQEWWGQQASWGLMQVMGAVARELGYRGRYLPSLTNPEANLAVGCQKLSGLLQRSLGDVERALAMYNGGALGNLKRPFRNAAYAAKVMKQYANIQGR